MATKFINNDRDLFINSSLFYAIIRYKSANKDKNSLLQLLIIYQIGILTRSIYPGGIRLIYISGNDQVKLKGLWNKLHVLQSRDLIIKNNHLYRLSPAGWLVFNNIYKMVEQYRQQYITNLDRSARVVKGAGVRKPAKKSVKPKNGLK